MSGLKSLVQADGSTIHTATCCQPHSTVNTQSSVDRAHHVRAIGDSVKQDSHKVSPNFEKG